MQATVSPNSLSNGRLRRNLGYFFIFPMIGLVGVVLATAVLVSNYQSRHDNRIYTGVSVAGVDLSELTRSEAADKLATAVPYIQQDAIQLTNPLSQESWTETPQQLGVSLDVAQMVDAAYAVGREGNIANRYRDIFGSYYYGRSLSPVIVMDEGQLGQVVDELATTVDKPAVNASVAYDGEKLLYAPGQTGYLLDTALAREQLLQPLTSFRPADIELPIQTSEPAIQDDPAAAAAFQQMAASPITFYLPNPLDELDLQPIVLPEDELVRWLRVENTAAGGYNIFVDENAVRHWLSDYETAVYREPVNARFYFDDDTRDLVLVAPHINGRSLDLDATVAQINSNLQQGNRAIPLIVKQIIPVVNSSATAAELGITELISERTTWFFGSTDARKHNIARGAANFFGIVVAPGEEFSFNKYLGTISTDDGYEEGLIIIGNRTIRGIGGGICQVSTTLFQTAFWAGFPITERWAHGYMLNYYNDGEGPGMDATVFSPVVDFRFINNTPYHLLIENYYSEENEALTMKMYSTSLGRVVEKTEPVFENVVPAPEEDVWEFNEDLPAGTVNQIDWATEGATVTVHRTVTNAEGVLLIDEDFVSQYIPWANAYHYGPGVDAPDYSLVNP
ncbi:MAG: VanW family protein [Anaerolineales bacterium]|nr:VanW family protein [Anaerolineales bacterium]